MGEVFRAHDAVLDRRVAIKVLHRSLSGDSGFVERFRREARAAANLSHPNIVAVHDWGAVDGIYYMVMEHVAGRSVREVLNAEGLLAPAQASDILVQALAALDHAHRQGIVHRDMKPENLMLTRDGVVKVADFGLARAYADAQITEAGHVTGTVQYLAPEQLLGEPADPRTDLYALGIVAFELLTGRLPFSGETPMAIAYKHIHDRVPRPSSRNKAVPKSIDGWVASITEKERELRPESAAEARRDLQAEMAGLPPAPPVGSLVPDVAVIAEPSPAKARAETDGGSTTVTIPRPAKRRRRRVRTTLGILLAIAAVAGAAWGTWTYLVPHRVDVPSVEGMHLDEARQTLEEAGLVPRIGQGRHSKQVEAGVILAVQPAEGTALEQGERVTLVPSLGPPPVNVPMVLGVPLSEAKDRLREAEFRVGEVTRAYSERFGVDQVIRQSVRGGTQAPFGSAIDLVVSRGPSPVAVPRVIGATEEDATNELQALGFLVTVEEAYSQDVRQGRVISQDPGKGSELQPGNAVTIVVSLGPQEFAMPNVVGMSRDAAVARLTELGLIVDVAIVPGQSGTLVVYQEPATGTIVHAGDTVSIYLA
jgi:eukaryotic-like serine/threonine-protein kinase